MGGVPLLLSTECELHSPGKTRFANSFEIFRDDSYFVLLSDLFYREYSIEGGQRGCAAGHIPGHLVFTLWHDWSHGSHTN